MISIATFSELLASLYAAPLDADDLSRFFNLLCESTQTASGVLVSHEKRVNCTQLLAGGGMNLDAEMSRAYNEHFALLDPYPEPFQRNPRIGVIDGYELVPREQLEKTEFFNDMLAGFDMHYSTLIPFVANADRIECITLWRGAGQGALTQESNTLLEALIPHLQSALGVMHVLQAAKERALRAEATLDALPTAAFLLNEDGCLLHMNKAAEHLARRQDGIRIQHNRLMALEVSRQATLRALISFAAAVGGAAPAEPGGAISLPRASSERPLHALVAPLRVANQSQCSPARVLVLITDPDAPAGLPRDTLSVLYGFTGSEVEVANGLLAGLSIEQVAELRHVSLGTARVQLKSLLHKTDTRRQSDLIRLLLSLPKTLPGKP